ncbi:MAG: SMC-Scp complex subunit ScpB [Myxococcota bacterium]
MGLPEERLHAIIESILLISPDPIPVARIVEVVRIEDAETEDGDVKAAIRSLVRSYADPDRSWARGIRIDEVAGALQFRTAPENADFVRRFLAAKPQRLTKPSLETLSIIAYRQPCTKPEIEAIRGVDAGAAIRGLLDRDLVRIVGKKEEVGRPILYGTTPYFLEFFGLKALSELPSLREYHELDEAHQQQVDDLDSPPTSLRDLAEAASFLVEQDQVDADLDALDHALHTAEKVGMASDRRQDPTESTRPGASTTEPS